MDYITTDAPAREEPVTVKPAPRAARRKKRPPRDESSLSVPQTIIMFALILAITFAGRFYVLQVATVDGVSMLNTLTSGERVLILMCGYWFDEPVRGDIVMCSYPGRDGSYIKRVLGLPGETVMIRDGTLYVDGRPIPERYVNFEASDDFGPTVVPDEHYFVIGDNRPVSGDSRLASVGALTRNDINGRAVAIVAPFDKFGALERR